MIHVAAVIASIAWLFLNGLLWYARPPGDIWLMGSVALGIAWGCGFFWYITRPSRS
jgi:hypothetical protein